MNFLLKILKYASGASHLFRGDRMFLYAPLSFSKILNRLEIPLPYENSFNKYNNPYNHEKFKKICDEYGVSDKNENSDENEVSDGKKS